MDPNFPAGLDIHPSSCPSHLELPHYAPDAQKESIKKFGIAGRVWEAAYAMISYIEPSASVEFEPPFLATEGPSDEPRTIIELGSGSGLVANHLSKTLRPSDTLVATDLPEVCELLEENLAGTQTLVKPLGWGNTQHGQALAQTLLEAKIESVKGISAIICSDLVYFPELFAPLLRSLIQLSSPTFLQAAYLTPPPPIYISYKIRSLPKETPFWAAFGLWFDFSPVLVRDVVKEGESTESESCMEDSWRRFGSEFDDTTFLFVARRRPDSYHWAVPDEDTALLAGKGAEGTDTPKSDGMFEALLLMSMPGS